MYVQTHLYSSARCSYKWDDMKSAKSSSVRPRPRTASNTNIAMPRYLWLHQTLLDDISSGKYPVGSLMPTEEQLGRIYSVSRHTVREATRKLVDSGLIVRRAGVGTCVRAASLNRPYVAALGSLKELMDYTNTTRLEVLGQRFITADAALARDLHCESGSEWLELQTRRHVMGQDNPISITQVYLRPEFARVVEHLQGAHPSIYELLRTLYQQEVNSVMQHIGATLMPVKAARLLDIKTGSPALRMLRCYFDPIGRLLTASVNLYVADRFQLVTSWSQD